MQSMRFYRMMGLITVPRITNLQSVKNHIKIFLENCYTSGYTNIKHGGIIMENIKTAISIQKPLFDEAEALAQELKVSRSGLFAMAVKEFIYRHKNHKMLQSINAAYADIDDTEEESLSTQRRSKHHNMVKDQW
jgi:hypothetical protein